MKAVRKKEQKHKNHSESQRATKVATVAKGHDAATCDDAPQNGRSETKVKIENAKEAQGASMKASANQVPEELLPGSEVERPVRQSIASIHFQSWVLSRRAAAPGSVSRETANSSPPDNTSQRTPLPLKQEENPDALPHYVPQQLRSLCGEQSGPGVADVYAAVRYVSRLSRVEFRSVVEHFAFEQPGILNLIQERLQENYVFDDIATESVLTAALLAWVTYKLRSPYLAEVGIEILQAIEDTMSDEDALQPGRHGSVVAGLSIALAVIAEAEEWPEMVWGSMIWDVLVAVTAALEHVNSCRTEGS